MPYSPFACIPPTPKIGEPFYDFFRHALPEPRDDGVALAEMQVRGIRVAVRIEEMPARFHSAEVTLPSGQVKRFSCGSGEEAGKLLEDLCNAFFEERATFGTLHGEEGELLLHLTGYAQEDGRNVCVEQMPDGWLVLFVAETESYFGNKPLQVFSVKDASLTERLVRAICQGMLDVTPAGKKAMSRSW